MEPIAGQATADNIEREAIRADGCRPPPDAAELARRERYAAETMRIAAAEARRYAEALAKPPAFEPDPDQMRAHLEHLFADVPSGLIELAWRDEDSGKLRHAHLYEPSDLDTLVEHAATINRRPGRNVFLGAATRVSDAPRSRRCSDSHFLALPAFYADFDDPGAAEQAARICHEQNCRPTLTVVTGRVPYLRCQVYWHLIEPERDPIVCKEQTLSIAVALGGDLLVTNPARVLRCGGSIAWPTKPGRVTERTELHLADPLRLVAHLIGRGWSDGEIMIAAAGLTLPSFTVEETRAELAQMIAAGRRKWDRPNQPHVLGQQVELSAKSAAYFRAAVEGEISRLRDAAPEHRLAVLGRAAGALDRFVAAGRFDPADLQNCLLRAAAMSGLDAASAVASIAAGMNARGVG